MPRPLKRVEHLSKAPEIPAPVERPELWTNRQCRDYARKKGLVYKDRLSIVGYAQRLGLDIRPLAVAPALLRAIAAYELARGEI